MQSLLVVNPNRSVQVTEGIQRLLEPLDQQHEVHYFTGPASAPAEITDSVTSALSLEACWPELELEADKHPGILVCCYSKHPLVKKLAEAYPKKFVTGIFESSLVYSVSKFPSSFAILTSNESWVGILNQSVLEFFGSDIRYFKGTYSSSVNVLGLQDPVNFQIILDKISEILAEQPLVKLILLGCAGFSGLENRFSESFPDIEFVDSVKVGYKLTKAFM